MLMQKTDTEAVGHPVAVQNGSNLVEASAVCIGERCDIVDMGEPLVGKREDGHCSFPLSFENWRRSA